MTFFKKIEKYIKQITEPETEEYKLNKNFVISTGLYDKSVNREYHQNRQHKVEIGTVILYKLIVS